MPAFTNPGCSFGLSTRLQMSDDGLSIRGKGFPRMLYVDDVTLFSKSS